MTTYHTTARLVILAPNWLGDAVMALPAIADVRRGLRDATITIAARPAIAPLFGLVDGVDEVITVTSKSLRAIAADVGARTFDTALLLPNSFHSALACAKARIPQRWGYRTDWRGRLLTRAIDPPSGLHQAEYYQQLVHALGFPNGPIEPCVTVPDEARQRASSMLRAAGWDGASPLVAIAPGAAYGGAKRWPPESFGELASSLAEDGVTTVIVGTTADRETADAVLARGSRRAALIDFVGKTDLPTLAGVFALCRALVTNDSGGMHLAAAVGTAVTAVFGPTDERATRPLGDSHIVVTGPAWCRPCLLRECPLDHRCMRGITSESVVAVARQRL